MAKKKDNTDGELIEVFTKNQGSRVEARLRMYNGRSTLDIRDWIFKDGSWMKTGRGFMIPVGRRADFQSFLEKVITVLDLQVED